MTQGCHGQYMDIVLNVAGDVNIVKVCNCIYAGAT